MLRRAIKFSKNIKKCIIKIFSLDPYFYELLDVLKKNRIKPVILSDNFSLIINYILKNNNIQGIKLYANKLLFSKNKLIPLFPYKNIDCFRCAHCKTNNLLKNKSRDKIIYIGDGLSDMCPSKYADIIFAKGTLLKNLKNTKKRCIAIKNLRNVSRYLRRKFNGTKK
ncbi:MAG: HAD-IB family phosphatase [Candidatus Omnitrophota bacterium]